MANSKKIDVGRIIAVVVSFVALIAAAALIMLSVYGVSIKRSDEAAEILRAMRGYALLNATGEGAVESFVSAAKKEATKATKAAGGDMAAIRDAVGKAEEEARANASNSIIDYDSVDTTGLDNATDALIVALKDYRAEEAAAKQVYSEQQAQIQADYAAAEEAALLAEEEALLQNAPPPADSIEAAGEPDLMAESEPEIDLSGFQATPEMLRLKGVVDEVFDAVADALIVIYPVLDVSSVNQLKDTITTLLCQHGDTFETEYDRYQKTGASVTLSSNHQNKALIISQSENMMASGVGLIILALVIMFYPWLVRGLGLPRLIIGLFFVLLCILSVTYDLSITQLLSNTIVRTGMNSILVLAMVPAIQSGISLNLGLPLGIIGGLIGGLMCIEFGYSGWFGFVYAIVIGLLISGVLGYLYGLLLNRLKGSEMAVTTYVGFSIVSLMCIGWLILPFKAPQLRWPLGTGLRVTLSMQTSYKHILNNALSFKIGGVMIPTGLLLFMAASCLLMWLFLRSKTGTSMQAAGNNPRFAEATGINVDKMRIIGTTLSTMLGAIGIIVYSQSYGFMQLYTAPRQLGFVAASAILIGGASTSRAKISHVIIGTFLFQGVITLGMPVANMLVPQSTLSETVRILISNGIILYALTKSGGDSRG